MRKAIVATLLALSGTIAATSAASAQSGTVRIEPRPFYGATVTLEEGVRVFRPLPPTRYVIVNPGSKTPLNLSINDTRVTETSTSNNYHYGQTAGAAGASGVAGPAYWGHGHRNARRGNAAGGFSPR